LNLLRKRLRKIGEPHAGAGGIEIMGVDVKGEKKYIPPGRGGAERVYVYCVYCIYPFLIYRLVYENTNPCKDVIKSKKR